MKRVVACVVLAVAVTGCGSSEPSWQDEWRESRSRGISDIDPVELLQEICLPLNEAGGRDIMKREILDAWSNNDDFLQIFEDLLDDFGAVANAKTLDEGAEIVIDAFISACP